MTYEEFKQRSEVVPASYNEGAFAALCISDKSNNPYEPYSLPWIEWLDGWLDLNTQLASPYGFRITFH